MKHISIKRIKELHQEYLDNPIVSVGELAQREGVSEALIYSRFRALGLEHRGTNSTWISSETKDKVQNLYESGVGYLEIVERVGIGRSTVHKILKSRGVKKWGYKEAAKKRIVQKTLERSKKAHELRQKGLTWEKIGTILNASPDNICAGYLRAVRKGMI